MGKKEKTAHARLAAQAKGGWLDRQYGAAKGKLFGIAGNFEQVVTSAAGRIPSNRLKMWVSGFFHPEEACGETGAKVAPAELALNLLVFYFVYSVIFFMFMLALTSSPRTCIPSA